MNDPLRPTTVPLDAETVLWFEYLIDPSLLTVYLSRNGNDDLKTIELINRFLAKPQANHPVSVQTVTDPNAPATNTPAAVGDAQPQEAYRNIGRKQFAQKILSLKFAAHLRWDLVTFERHLTLQKQVQLLGDLCSVSAGKLISLPMAEDVALGTVVGADGNESALRFALALYHRWVLRTQLLKELPARLAKGTAAAAAAVTASAAAQQSNDPTAFRCDAFMAALDPTVQYSVDFLQKLVSNAQTSTPFAVLTYDSFTAIASASVSTTSQSAQPQQQLPLPAQTFDAMRPISAAELRTQIYFDLCTFYLHSKKYNLARDNALLCCSSMEELQCEQNPTTGTNSHPTGLAWCTVDEATLRGYLLACGIADPVKPPSLMHRLTESVLHGFAGLAAILHEDNLCAEIPLCNRRIVELDLEALVSRAAAAASVPPSPAGGSGVGDQHALLVEVAALNAIRAALDCDGQQQLFAVGDFLTKYRRHGGLQQLVQSANAMLPHLAADQRPLLRRLFAGVLMAAASAERLRSDCEVIAVCKLFGVSELQAIVEGQLARLECPVFPVPQLAAADDWLISDSKDSHLELGTIKRQLVSCSSPQMVRQLLIRLAATQPSQPLWSVNPSWVLPTTLHSTVMSLQRGFLQDFVYILVGKSKELAERHDYAAALAALACLKAECSRPDLLTNGTVRKLERQLDWELLAVQLAHTLHAWPRPCYEQAQLLQRCKQVLAVLHQHQHPQQQQQHGDNVLPRMEVVLACATMLLNLGDWSPSNWPEKRFQPLELCAVFAAAAAEAESFGGGVKKVCRDAWETVLPMFLRDAQSLVGGSSATALMPFLRRLRGVGIITVVLSLLSRLHNLLKDDSNMEIQADYLSLWPASLSNTSAYSIRAVAESLGHLLKQGLQYHPQHLAWIRLSGDYEFVCDNNEAAMAHYVAVLLTGTEYCTLHLQQRQLLDDHMTRRMIKASLNLGCNIQAAILCQLLDDIDYGLAFKCIAERTTFKNIGDKAAHYCDAMDAYYGCVWDATLLEYIIQQHCRKGEHKRKQQTIALISQLELNANNNEEIKREAASIRRTRFLRALAKQYML